MHIAGQRRHVHHGHLRVHGHKAVASASFTRDHLHAFGMEAQQSGGEPVRTVVRTVTTVRTLGIRLGRSFRTVLGAVGGAVGGIARGT